MYIYESESTKRAQNEEFKQYEGLTMHDIESELFDHDLSFLSDNTESLDLNDILQ